MSTPNKPQLVRKKLPPKRVKTLTNAQLAALQIKRHGVDRYPDWQAQLRKVVEEVGEINKEVNRSPISDPKVGRECADAALALYNFCAKIGVDLDKVIREVVMTDERRFG